MYALNARLTLQQQWTGETTVSGVPRVGGMVK